MGHGLGWSLCHRLSRVARGGGGRPGALGAARHVVGVRQPGQPRVAPALPAPNPPRPRLQVPLPRCAVVPEGVGLGIPTMLGRSEGEGYPLWGLAAEAQRTGTWAAARGRHRGVIFTGVH